MKKSIYTLFFFYFALTIFSLSTFVFAATLQVTKIGGLDLGGKNYNEWWYTGTSPVFYGTASPGSQVRINISGTDYTVNSDSQGLWNYASNLQTGDFLVSFFQGSETVSFTLHLGQSMPSGSAITSQTSTSATPVTGYNQIVYLSLGAGILLLATYFYIRGDPRRKSIFEAKIIEE